MGRFLLNCDLGENESASQTQHLLAWVDAANICCGVHAGSPDKTRATIEAAQAAGVLIGVHPGLAVAGGRGAALPEAAAFARLLDEQVGGFLQCADQLACPVHHIKLHGSLYSAVEQDEALAAVYADFLETVPGLKVFTLAGGSLMRRVAGAIPELFADRGYRADGSLVPRSEPGALIEALDPAVARLEQWARSGLMPTVDGGSVRLSAQTVCVHSDSPNAAELLQRLSLLRG